MEWLFFFIALAVLMFLHELGHVLLGLLVGYKFESIGFSSGAIFPHVAMMEPEESQWRERVFLLGGFLSTVTLFLLVSFQFLNLPQAVFAAFFVQFMLETNPFFSDFSMLLFYRESYLPYKSDINQLKEKIKDQWFTPKWYIHLTLWAVGVIGFLRLLFGA